MIKGVIDETLQNQNERNTGCHVCMARDGHGLPKVSHRPAMPYPFMPCGRATPEVALWSF
jgi:hypothetical protein